METSAVLAGAEDRVVDEAAAELERRHSRTTGFQPESVAVTAGSVRARRQVRARGRRSSRSSRRRTSWRRTVSRPALILREVQGEFNVLEEVLWRRWWPPPWAATSGSRRSSW